MGSEDDELPRYLPKSVMDKLSLTYEIDLTNRFVWGCELASNSTEAPSELVELLKTKTCLEIIQPAALSAINLVKQSALAHQRGEKIEELEDYKNRRSLYEYGKDGDLTGCESACTYGALGNCVYKVGSAVWSCYTCFACSPCANAVWNFIVGGFQDCCVCYSKYVDNVCSYC